MDTEIDKTPDTFPLNHPLHVVQSTQSTNSKKNSENCFEHRRSISCMLPEIKKIFSESDSRTTMAVSLILQKAGIDQLLLNAILEACTTNWKMNREVVKVIRQDAKSTNTIAQEIVCVYREYNPYIALDMKRKYDKYDDISLSDGSLHLGGCLECLFKKKKEKPMVDINATTTLNQTNCDEVIETNSKVLYDHIKSKGENTITKNQENIVYKNQEAGCLIKCFIKSIT